jgi:hypothetical protein
MSVRGFAEGAGVFFPQEAPNDRTRQIGALVARTELFFEPRPRVQFAAGIDLRGDTHNRVEDRWRLDYSDRTVRRPPLAVRRLAVTLARGWLTIDAGKQFVRWGKTDIVTPSDRFAPRDFLNVIDSEFLAITAVRAVAEAGSDTFDAVWAPRFTPSRIPLVDQRWSAPPAGVPAVRVLDGNAPLPSRSQFGIRWSHIGAAAEYSVSYFDGLNHLPTIRPDAGSDPQEVVVTRLYPSIRTYGGDLAVPTAWFTIKGEATYFAASGESRGPGGSDDYVLYVVQIERQTGEWVLVGGYAGEVVAERRSGRGFAPDRGLTRAVVARASYTIDVNRSVAFEGAVRQNGRGVYGRAEYSQAHGQHWRTTVAGVAIGGAVDDFLGQYKRNSHATVTLRYSF